jgi:hypothetical protein
VTVAAAEFASIATGAVGAVGSLDLGTSVDVAGFSVGFVVGVVTSVVDASGAVGFGVEPLHPLSHTITPTANSTLNRLTAMNDAFRKFHQFLIR